MAAPAWANTLPVAEDARFPSGSSVKGTLQATDADGDELTFLVDTVFNGTVVFTNDKTGEFTYTPNVGRGGADSFRYKVSDGTGFSTVATVRILPLITISSSLQVLLEATGGQTNAADITFTRIGATDESIQVLYDLSGTATPQGKDYNLSLGSTTLLPASSILSATLTVSPDQEIEGDETVTITLNDGDNYFAGTPNSVTVIIQDDQARMPKANFQLDQMVQEGATTKVRVDLSEAAEFYPVVIPFTLSSRPGAVAASVGADFTVSANEIRIEAGTSGEVTLETIADGLNEPTDESIVFNMGQLINARPGNFRTQTVFITERNIQAAVALSADQAGRRTRVVTADGGLVTVSADVTDINVDQQHVYDWSESNNAVFPAPGSQGKFFVFDPSNLTPGFYKLRVAVTNTTGSAVTTRSELQLKVEQTAPPFVQEDTDGDGVPDETESYGDDDNDGIQNYYDSNRLARNVLQQQPFRTDKYLIQTRPGLSLSLGDTAMATERGAALVTAQDIGSFGGGEGTQALNATDVQVNTGGYYDFEVHGLTVPGMPVFIVIPQNAPIPSDAVYRKYTPTLFWHDFAFNNNNQVYSAAGEEGVCPPAGDSAYSPGLNEGHYCVQLLIQDGGPNDADSEQNFIIKDPGGLVTSLITDGDTAVRGACGNLFCSEGGSGALGWAGVSSLFLSALVGAGLRRRKAKAGW